MLGVCLAHDPSLVDNLEGGRAAPEHRAGRRVADHVGLPEGQRLGLARGRVRELDLLGLSAEPGSVQIQLIGVEIERPPDHEPIFGVLPALEDGTDDLDLILEKLVIQKLQQMLANMAGHIDASANDVSVLVAELEAGGELKILARVVRNKVGHVKKRDGTLARDIHDLQTQGPDLEVELPALGKGVRLGGASERRYGSDEENSGQQRSQEHGHLRGRRGNLRATAPPRRGSRVAGRPSLEPQRARSTPPMTSGPPQHELGQSSAQPGPAVAQVSGERLIRAVMRITPGTGLDPRTAAERFLAGAKASGLDTSGVFATFREGGDPNAVGQACIAIPGPGKTGMVFMSGPGGFASLADERAARVACLESAASWLAGRGVHLAQALPDSGEQWASEAYKHAGFIWTGDLAYLAAPLPGRRMVPEPVCPSGVTLRPLRDLGPGSDERRRLGLVLEQTYIDTLDCPELTGLRDVEDIIESHLATGVFDPGRWVLAYEGATAVGCALVSLTEDPRVAELVYMGLVPEARGRGLGRAMLHNAISGLRRGLAQRIVCAADRRNTPALRLYESFGFRAFSDRRAWVLPVTG